MNGITPSDEDIFISAISDLEGFSEQNVIPKSQAQILPKPPVVNSNRKNKIFKVTTILIILILIGLFVDFCIAEYKSHNEYESDYYQGYTEEITDSDSQRDNKKYIEIENSAANEIANLYDDLELENAIQCFYVYCTLIEEGHFSKEKFEYNENNLHDYKYALGYDVLLGKGTCRHEDDLFRLSMEKAGYDIKSTTSSLESNLSDLKNDEANHQVSIINENGDTYVLDVTNCLISDNYSNEFAVYCDYYTTYYNRILPEYSIEENGYLTSYNIQNDVNLINSWMENDCNSLDADYINSQQQYVCELLNEDSAKEIIKIFDLDYYNNVIFQMDIED